MFVAMGPGNDPQLIRPLLGPAGNVLGTLLQVNAAGGWRVVADIAAYEAAVDPNGGPIKMIVDLDFDDDGTLYVLQFATGPVFFTGPGELIRIAPDGSRIAASPRDLARCCGFPSSAPASEVDRVPGAAGNTTVAPIREFGRATAVGRLSTDACPPRLSTTSNN